MQKNKKVIVTILCMALFISLLSSGALKISPSKAAEYDLSNPKIENGTTTWDCVYFGNYWQSEYEPINEPVNPEINTTYTDTDGTKFVYRQRINSSFQDCYYKKIKWRVLSVNGNDAFLLADKNLFVYKYGLPSPDERWEANDLRYYLSGVYKNAFTELEQDSILSTLVINDDIDEPHPIVPTGEKKNITDKVYILSLSEAMNPNYGFNAGYAASDTRVVSNTEYIGSAETDVSFSWLRTRANNRSFQPRFIAVNNNNGEIDLQGYSPTNEYGVRPCLHIDLSKDTWTKAESVSAEVGEVVPMPTPTPTPTPTPKATQPPNTQATAKPTQAPRITSSPTPTVTPNTVTAPGKVKKLKVKNNKKRSVTVSWKKVKGAKGYQVQYVTNKAFSKKKSKFVKKNKFTVKKLKKKKTYYFRVQAYKLNGKQKVYGKWSVVKKIKIKK